MGPGLWTTTLTLHLGAATAAPPDASCKGCNILWIVVDTTRNDRVGAKGVTPAIDKLAARGTRFPAAFSQGPSTMVSVSSYMSGRYPLSTGMDFDVFNRETNWHPCSPELTTLAEVLKTKGYKTVGYTANKLLSRGIQWDLGVHQGFDTWTSGDDAAVTTQALGSLEQLKGGPFLLYVHLMGPHHPNPQLPGFEGRRGPAPVPPIEAVDHVYGKVNKGQMSLTPAQEGHLRKLYDDALWEADGRVGQILAALDAKGLGGKTLVVLTSDHGESLGEQHNGKPVWGHGHALTRDLLEVPLVLAGPGVPVGKGQAGQVAELVDLNPTLIDLLGIPQEAAWGWQGSPLVGKNQVKGTTALASRGVSPNRQLAGRDLSQRVEFVETAKRWWTWSIDGSPEGAQKPTPAGPAQAAMQSLLQTHWDNARPPGSPAPTSGDVDAETLRQLQELGYMQ